MSGIRVRFAPSPTGPLHIGGARSALFNWLYARRYGGTFIVRIEDTDLVRSSRESEENILAALRWLGLDWDEGIGVGGLSGPYRQTERLELYGQIIDELLRGGQAYYCYCSEEELAKEKEKQLARGEAVPMYSGRCRCLTHEQRLEKEARGLKPVIRFKVPQDKTVLVSDQVRGEVSFDCLGIGDFIIVKSDGIPTYNFAVVVDDYHMQVSHVIRAEEHLSNTPRQVLIYQALGWSVPHFAHVSLILGSDRSKMSKRHGATAIEQYQEQGYLPEALVNFLALLGWSPEGENELLTPEQIVEQFSLDRVAKNPAVFDVDKLNWINGHYIRQSPVERITELALPFLRQAGYVGEEVTQEQYQWLKLLVYTVKDYLTTVADINSHVSIFFSEDIELDSQESREILSQQEVPRVLSAMRQKIEDAGTLDEATVKVILKGLAKELGLAGKKVFMPLRVALTGKTHGPELHLVIPVLGRDKTIKRLISAQRDK